ncbi:Psmd12 [Symbiodinium sp. KB8]|nr:Psmd12 [Symbiodinium sp. KB8]
MPPRQRWLQDVVDVLLLLAFAAATKDEAASQVALTSAALSKTSAWDSVSLVVTLVSKVDLAFAIRSSLLERLQGLPPQTLAEGFNDWAKADLGLALRLLEAQQAARENPARFRARQDGQRRLKNMPKTAWGHHEFAFKVFVDHEDRLSSADFERLLRHMVFNRLLPEEVFRLVLACLAHAQPAAARELFVFAANTDETEAIRLMLKTELPLTALGGNMSEVARASIFHAVMSDWAPHGSRDMAALLSCIKEDRRHIQQLLAWARANKCVAIAANHHLEDALLLALASGVEVGSLLMCTLAACGVLPAALAPEIPLEWLGDLRALPEGRQVVTQGLLAQLEPCEDEQLVQRMRRFWQFEVWPEVDGSTCERAVRLLSRFCQAEPGPAAVVFACKVLRGLPLNELPGAELLYEPSLPAQGIGIRAEQLAHSLANEAKQAAKGALEKAQEALREAQRALRQAEQAHRGADGTRDLARQAVQTALRGEQLALQALEEQRLDLINTLNEVTEGKIFVEVEKARLTSMLANMKEEEGKVDEAASLIQEVQVESFGAMERREKTEYILNQMRLVLAKKDFVRTQIISRKINPKLLDADDFQDLKIRYYEYMIRYWLHEGKFLDVAKCTLAIFNTPSVKSDESKWIEWLTAYCIYLVLSPYDNEHDDMLQKLDSLEGKKLDKVPTYRNLIRIFMKKEIVNWPLAKEEELKKHAVFQDSPHEGAKERWELLKKRVVQHNIKVVSEYYEQIHTKRLCELVGLGDKETEEELSELVCSKFVYARIDRPAGTIKFGKKQTYIDRLNSWSDNITKMLDLVENTSHLIQKEQMVHAARAKLKSKK